jgi:PAS domain S-box-containing protein
VTLHAPPGWSGIKELLAYGRLDAAHVLSPMPLAAQLGVDVTPEAPILNVIQNVNGQALTLHVKHLGVRGPGDLRGMTFGVPYAYSMHYYLLCHYLAEHGVDPLREVRIVEVAPPAMPAYLEQETVDGVLAPEPFNQIPVNRGIGYIHILSKDIWEGHPCCAFASSPALARAHPNTHRAMVEAVLEAEAILHQADEGQRREIARLISGPRHLDLEDPSAAEQVLTGVFDDGRGHPRRVPDRIDFLPHLHPDTGAWMIAQMQRWGQLRRRVDYGETVAKVFVPLGASPTPAEGGLVVPAGFDPSDPFAAMARQPFSAFVETPPAPRGGGDDGGAPRLADLIDPLVAAVGGDLTVTFPQAGTGGLAEVARLLDELVRNAKFMQRRLEDRERAMRRQKAATEAQLHARAEELRCLFRVSSALQSALDPADALPDIARILPEGWRSPSSTIACVRLDGVEHASGDLERCAHRLAMPIEVDGVERGRVTVGHRGALPGEGPGRWLAEERTLLEAVAAMIGKAAEARDVRSKYARLYHGAPDMYATLDADGCVLECNRTLLRKTGFRRADLTGRRFVDLCHRSVRQEAARTWQALTTAGQVVDAPLRLRREDGGYIDVSVNLTWDRDAASGQAARARSSWRDISERMVLERRLDRTSRTFRQVLETMPLGYADHEMLFDADGEPADFIWRAMNRAFPAMTGLTLEAALDRRFLEVVPEGRSHDPDLVALYGRVVKEQTNAEFQLHFAPFERWYRVVAFPTGPSHFGVLFLETTAEVRGQRELEALNAQLRESNTELEQFAYVASHDLQEPLRMVASYTGLLAERYEGQLDAKADRYIHHAVSGAKRMQALIADLLSFSRAGRQELRAERVDLGEVLASVRHDLSPLIDERGALIDAEGLVAVRGDRLRVAQVLQNLLSNAIKFTPDGAPRVELRARRRGGWVEVSVTDHGVGIEPDKQERIFEIFKRLHHRSEVAGTGIGLAVVKKIVERHGGEIHVSSTPGGGSTFTFTLPAWEAEEAPEHPSAPRGVAE